VPALEHVHQHRFMSDPVQVHVCSVRRITSFEAAVQDLEAFDARQMQQTVAVHARGVKYRPEALRKERRVAKKDWTLVRETLQRRNTKSVTYP